MYIYQKIDSTTYALALDFTKFIHQVFILVFVAAVFIVPSVVLLRLLMNAN